MKLFAWARAVAAMRRRGRRLPVLWLFSDARRLPDPLPTVRRLPPGLAGVVLRHDGAPGRAALGAALAAVCRRRRLALVVAGDTRLAAALRAGVHLRAGRWPRPIPRLRRRGGLVTSSAHGTADIRRARLAGADLVFLSPVFATASHPGDPALGPVRWAGLARRAGVKLAALGGVSGRSVRRLDTARCVAIGAISGLVEE